MIGEISTHSDVMRFLLVIVISINSVCSYSSRASAGLQQASKQQVPAALEAKECGPAKNKNELPNDRFARKGGRETKVDVRMEQKMLTITGISEGRNLSAYERLNIKDPASSSDRSSMLTRARSYLWEHWRDKKAAYLTFTGSSVDATSTSHIFVEADQSGRWRVAWRIVRDTGVIDDLPTYYAVEWVRPGGWRKPGLPLATGEKPDPRKHELEFRDVCGDVENSL